jgi:hypothetical protein
MYIEFHKYQYAIRDLSSHINKKAWDTPHTERRITSLSTFCLKYDVSITTCSLSVLAAANAN